MIVAVAIKGNMSGLIYSLPKPARHCDVLHTMLDSEIEIDNPNEGQGFLTDTGDWVDRRTAAQIALMRAQITEPKAELFSEDLW